ncbi:hypothetical protein KAR91_81420, partial [Candidatus Pacearchaeota archaeon]|nr:hypothetical protein [Candidatus Pacearchaeota archaeon]
IYALRHLSYDDMIIGTPFIGGEVTLAGKDGDMYAFVSGFDKDIGGITLRTTASFRTYDGALQASHKDESDDVIGKVEMIIRF